MTVITFARYIPPFVDWDDDEPVPTVEVETMEELLNCEFVQRFSSIWPDGYLVKSHDLVLWKVSNERWFILGTVDRPDLIDTPEWNPHEYRNQSKTTRVKF